jgi:rubrerythrin
MQSDKECPMCGERMRLKERRETARIPGTSQMQSRPVLEWICPDCDYFEEADQAGVVAPSR